MANRKRRCALATIALSCLFLAMPGLARAATITVSTTNDPSTAGQCGLRDAIDAANSQAAVNGCTAGSGHKDTIVFDAGVTGTITLSSTLGALPAIVLGETLTITGPAASPGITISGGGKVQVMAVNSGATLNLQVLTLEDGSVSGNAGGGIGAGGAIWNHGTLTVTNCTFSGNQATGSLAGHGGAICNDFGTLTVTNSTFSDNQANGSAGFFGGAAVGGAILSGGTLTVVNSTFSANQAVGGDSTGRVGGNSVGGAIFNDFSGMLTVANSTFSDNQAIGGASEASEARGGDASGGAIVNADMLTVTNSTFSSNQAAGGAGGSASIPGGGVGGAISNASSATLTVTNSTFSGNDVIGAPFRGAIENDGGAVSLQGTILAGSSPNNCNGTITASYSLADDATCFTNGTDHNMVVASTSDVGLDPMGLAMNGGLTETIALEPSSPAVDNIPITSCTYPSGSLNPCTTSSSLQLTCDQRGLPRPDFGNPNFCDAGAFELQTTPVVIETNGERVQIVHASNPTGDQLNTAFTFIENGAPTCDADDDAFNGFTVTLSTGTCADLGNDALSLMLDPFTVHTVNKESYGTFFFGDGPFTVSARMVELPTPAPPACGEFTMNLEVTGIGLDFLGDGPFALILSRPDGDRGCLDITNAIVGNQIPTPGRVVRRGVRRQLSGGSNPRQL